ncbi:MAG: histidine kinase dimerization/phospho-acceptor domain-containing protein, partial [Myxococcota bacterium]
MDDDVDGVGQADPVIGRQAKTRRRNVARDRDQARRTYAALTRFEDTGPQALLGLARLALVSGDRGQAIAQYRQLGERFGARLDNSGIAYRLLADVGRAEVSGEPRDLLSIYRDLLDRRYPAPSALLNHLADDLRGRLAVADLDDPDLSAQRDRLGARLDRVRAQVPVARALSGEIDEIVRSAGPRLRGRPALTAPDRVLIYRRLPDRDITGILVDIAMLEAEAADASRDLSRLAPGARAVVERPGDAAERLMSERTLASTGFGAILPHLSLSLVNDRRLPDPLDAIIEARGRRHLAITGGLVALLVLGLIATIRGAARERELARLKSDFVSTVSHELKTPLTSIRMFGEMLQQGVAGEDRERETRYHDVIVKESQRLGLLI